MTAPADSRISDDRLTELLVDLSPNNVMRRKDLEGILSALTELRERRAQAVTEHTEPVAGEVERYSLNIPTSQMYADKNGIFVLASSYDALAAAKDATDRDMAHAIAWTTELSARAEAAERQRDALRELLYDIRDHVSDPEYIKLLRPEIETLLKDEGGARP